MFSTIIIIILLLLSTNPSFFNSFRFGRDVKIVHFIGPIKPWHHSYNPATGNVNVPSSGRGYVPHERTFLQLWWDIHVTFVEPEMRVSDCSFFKFWSKGFESVGYKQKCDGAQHKLPWGLSMVKFMVPLLTTCQNWPATMFCFFFLAIYSMFLGRSRGLVVSTLHIRCGYSYFTPPLSAHQFTMMRMCLPITSHLFLGEESSLLSPIISINWHTKVFRSCAVLLCHTIFPRIIAVPWLITSLE